MNDRFKFRGFHPVLAELQEIKYIDFIHNTVDFGDGDIFDIEEVKLQKSTGIRDKNGKLIYEGDILDCPSWWWGNGYIYLDYNECGPCYADSVVGQYILSHNIDEPKKGATYNLWNGKEVEIIGNIYENPELLSV